MRNSHSSSRNYVEDSNFSRIIKIGALIDYRKKFFRKGHKVTGFLDFANRKFGVRIQIVSAAMGGEAH